jgi:hypothetical protein
VDCQPQADNGSLWACALHWQCGAINSARSLQPCTHGEPSACACIRHCALINKCRACKSHLTCVCLHLCPGTAAARTCTWTASRAEHGALLVHPYESSGTAAGTWLKLARWRLTPSPHQWHLHVTCQSAAALPHHVLFSACAASLQGHLLDPGMRACH